MPHVYLLKANVRRSTIYKIGMTDRPNPRDRYLEISQEWWQKRRIKVLPVRSISVRDASAVEAHLHRQFKAYSIFGKEMAESLGGGWCSGDSEWFAASVEKPVMKEFDRLSRRKNIAPSRSHKLNPRKEKEGRISPLLVGAILVSAVAFAVWAIG